MENENVIIDLCPAKKAYVDRIFYEEDKMGDIEDFVEDILDVSVHRIVKNITKNYQIKPDEDTLNTVHRICIEEISSSKIMDIYINDDFFNYISSKMSFYMFNNFKLMYYLANTENVKEISLKKSLIKHNDGIDFDDDFKKLEYDEINYDKDFKKLENNRNRFKNIIKTRGIENIFTNENLKKNQAKVFELTSNIYTHTLLNMTTYHISLDDKGKKTAEKLLLFSFKFLDLCSIDSKFNLNKNRYTDKIVDLYFFERYYNYFFDFSCLTNIEQLFRRESQDFKMLITNTLLPIAGLPNVFYNGWLVSDISKYISDNYYNKYELNTKNIHDCILFYSKIVIPLYNSLLLLVLKNIYKDKNRYALKRLLCYKWQFIFVNPDETIREDALFYGKNGFLYDGENKKTLFDAENLFGLIYSPKRINTVEYYINEIKFKYLDNNDYRDDFFKYIVSKVDEENNYKNTTINDLREYITICKNEKGAVYDYIMGNDNKKEIEKCLRGYISL